MVPGYGEAAHQAPKGAWAGGPPGGGSPPAPGRAGQKGSTPAPWKPVPPAKVATGDEADKAQLAQLRSMQASLGKGCSASVRKALEDRVAELEKQA